MATTQLEKFKNSIKPELLDKFDKNLMVSSGFIPVDIRNNDFFIIIKKSMATNKPEIEAKAKEICQNDTCIAKFISLADAEFEELFANVSETLLSGTAPKAKTEEPVNTTSSTTSSFISGGPVTINGIEITYPAHPQMNDEEFFLQNGWVRQNHLPPAKEMSKKKNMPMYAAFCACGFVSDAQVRAYLLCKYKVEIIKAEDIVIDLDLFKGLNDDFIFKKFSIPFEVSGSKLKVAMLNPADKTILREIS